VKATFKKVWTYEDYLKLDDEKRYEIIEGEIYVAPAPSTLHQAVLMTLYKMMDKAIGDSGIIFVAPVDVVLSEKDVVQPDIVVITNERKEIIKEKGIFGPPDLAVEIVSSSSFTIVSSSSFTKDTEIKRQLYAKYSVKEYWIIFPKEEFLEILMLKGGEYTLLTSSDTAQKLCSSVFKDLCVDANELFRNAKSLIGGR